MCEVEVEIRADRVTHLAARIDPRLLQGRGERDE